MKIIDKTETVLDTILTSKGPIPIDQEDQRYQPYIRRSNHATSSTNGSDHILQEIATTSQNGSTTAITENQDSSYYAYIRPCPQVLILTKSDKENPTRLDINIRWSGKHELSIDKCKLPDETYYEEGGPKDKLRIFLQLNPNVRELKSFYADVKPLQDGSNKNCIGPIVISVKVDMENAVEKTLVNHFSTTEREEAERLVQAKSICQLTAGIGPNKDTVLAVLCAQKPMKSQTLAQIYTVIGRIINHSDNRVSIEFFF